MKIAPILKLWGMPIAIALLSIFGLIIALAGSSILWDIWSWMALAIPLLLIINKYFFNRH
ncbi:hypothetical protein ACFRAE_00905 [Sphingobacterium sp. HJSM2_6]|uniref:hypothetical protein n=1 Tax=Sphingobacterium sp. HJSM2_6 TaxID=3366264 RepID=UPI003BD558CC